MRTAPTKLCVIDLVPQHNVKANGELAGHRHFGYRGAFAKCQAAISPLQSRVVPAGGLGRFDQEKSQQAIALLGQVPKALLATAGFLLRDQPQVTGQVPEIVVL